MVPFFIQILAGKLHEKANIMKKSETAHVEKNWILRGGGRR
jgi:hypothetical protein